MGRKDGRQLDRKGRKAARQENRQNGGLTGRKADKQSAIQVPGRQTGFYTASHYNMLSR